MPLLSGNPSTPSRTVNNNNKRKCSPSSSPCSVCSPQSPQQRLSGDNHKQAMNTPPKSRCLPHAFPPIPPPTPSGFSTKLCSDMCTPALNPGGERADCHSSVKAAWVGRQQQGPGWKRRAVSRNKNPGSDSQQGHSFVVLGKLLNLSDFLSRQTE